MTKHWRPDETAVPLLPASAPRKWTRPEGYEAQAATRWPDGARAGLLLLATVCVGIGFGLYQMFAPLEPVAPEASLDRKQ